MSIHKTALIDESARLGEGVRVGPYAYIAANTDIGDGCEIGPHSVIHSHTTLGARCRVHAGAVLGDIPQDLAFEGGESYLRIGPDCIIREGVTIHRGTKSGSTTEVGEGCFLMAFSHLAHNVRLGRGVIMANGALCGGYVEVGDMAFLSGNVVVHQFCRVGRLAMLSGNSGISKDLPPYCVTVGCSRNAVGSLNVVGMRRAGVSPEDRKGIKRAFQLLYRSGLNTEQAVRRMKEELPERPAAEFIPFIESAQRGICGGHQSRDHEEDL